MYKETTYFFNPRVGKKYFEKGFKGIKLLIVGAHHYCTLNCKYKEKCNTNSGVIEVDKKCPEYIDRENKEYYKLSNSNIIEINSYIEESQRYYSYNDFTTYMLDKRDGEETNDEITDFWESVCFYNYTQHYLSDRKTPPFKSNQKLYTDDYKALLSIIDELEPEILLVWNPAIRDCILNKDKDKSFAYLGITDMQRISVYVFSVKRYIKRNALRKFIYAYNVKSQRRTKSGSMKLVKQCFGLKSIDSGSPYAKLINVLDDMIKIGFLYPTSSCLLFLIDDWNDHNIGFFYGKIKDYLDLPHGCKNKGLGELFGDNRMEKYTYNANLKDPFVNDINKVWNRNDSKISKKGKLSGNEIELSY